MPDRFETGQMEAKRHYRERAPEMRQQAQSAMTQKLRPLLLENANFPRSFDLDVLNSLVSPAAALSRGAGG